VWKTVSKLFTLNETLKVIIEVEGNLDAVHYQMITIVLMALCVRILLQYIYIIR